jgi:uncharacterized protein YlxP (DUF503 family)
VARNCRPRRDRRRRALVEQRITLRIARSTSLEAKRSTVRHLVERSRSRFEMSASEVAER